MNNERLNQFFNLYEKRFNAGVAGKDFSVAEVMACFTDCFVESSPVGVICGKNDEEFRKKIPEGYKFYRQIGITRMDITGREFIQIDELHHLAKISWRSVYSKDGKEGAIDFVVNYLLSSKDDQYKIFAYITGDEQAELRKNGLI